MLHNEVGRPNLWRLPLAWVAVAVAATLVAVSAAPVSVQEAVAAPAPGGEFTSTLWPGGQWQPDAVQYGMTVKSAVPLTMSDGVVLFANIGYPTDPVTRHRAPGPFPVLLTQNPYVGASEQPDPFYVDRGYIFVSVEVRGTLDSEAPNNAPLLNDLFGARQVKDGVELVDWAAHRLDGSDGVVGLTGCSQLGIIQLFVAAAIGPNSPVKAILPACASNGYDGIYFAGGIPGPTIGLFGQPIVGTISGTKHLPENVFVGGLERGDILAGGPLAYNGQYWQQRTTSPALAAQIVANGIPALLWSGWKAPEAMGALEFYAALQDAAAGKPPYGPMAAGQPTTGRYQIIVGPWGHGQGLDDSIGLEWYDTWLKGEHTGIDQTSTPMHLFENGSELWKNASTYPLAARYTTYQLGPGTLTGQVQPQLPLSQTGPDLISWGQPGRPGTSLTYTTAPFTAAAELAGPVAVSIDASVQQPEPGAHRHAVRRRPGRDGHASHLGHAGRQHAGHRHAAIVDRPGGEHDLADPSVHRRRLRPAGGDRPVRHQADARCPGDPTGGLAPVDADHAGAHCELRKPPERPRSGGPVPPHCAAEGDIARGHLPHPTLERLAVVSACPGAPQWHLVHRAQRDHADEQRVDRAAGVVRVNEAIHGGTSQCDSHRASAGRDTVHRDRRASRNPQRLRWLEKVAELRR